MIPKKVFFTKGLGIHKQKLQSFEIALQDAGIEKCNLVNVSSVLPPKCKIISKKKGISLIKPGQITYCVMSRISTKEYGKHISAAIGAAFTKNESLHGYIAEHGYSGTEKINGREKAEKMAVSMLANHLATDNKKKKKQKTELDRYVIKTKGLEQKATGEKNDLWTTAVAAAVFLEG